MAIKFSPIFSYTVRGNSMQTTYESGDTIYVNRLAYLFKKPKMGDIVVIKHPHKNIRLIKRVVKMVPEGYFVTGDNRRYSADSRYFGPIKHQNIIGKVYAETKPRARG
jgi:nickel-type superoxide dismutase maturation protease